MISRPEISGSVVGAERVVRRFSVTIPAEVRRRVGLTVRELGLTLERKVKLEKLQGQVLGRRTGRLVRSINTAYRETPETFTASTGTRLVYGRAWELGFHGIVHVREFTRQGALVRAHTRRVDMNARPFLRSTLDEMRPVIRERIAAAFRGL